MYRYFLTRPPRSCGPSCLDRTCCMFRTTSSSPSLDSCDSQDTFSRQKSCDFNDLLTWKSSLFDNPSWLSDHLAFQLISAQSFLSVRANTLCIAPPVSSCWVNTGTRGVAFTPVPGFCFHTVPHCVMAYPFPGDGTGNDDGRILPANVAVSQDDCGSGHRRAVIVAKTKRSEINIFS